MEANGIQKFQAQDIKVAKNKYPDAIQLLIQGAISCLTDWTYDFHKTDNQNYEKSHRVPSLRGPKLLYSMTCSV